MDAFGVFKIVLGIVISVFILIMVYNFANSYMDIDTSKRQISAFMTFEKNVRDVYVNGIPVNYSFESDLYSAITLYKPPHLVTKAGNIDFGFVPLFFRKGRELSISRTTNDLGWWKFDYVTVLPKTNIIFIPMENSNDIWDTIAMISSSFPDTENIEPDITFGFGCEDVSYFRLEKWKRDIFVKEIIPYINTMIDFKDECVESTKNEEVVIYISDEMIEFKKGILVVTAGPFWGHMYTNESGVLREFVYKDGLDIMSFALGGEFYYIYKNNIHLNQLAVAAKLKSDELELLKTISTRPDCPALYSVFSGILQQIYDGVTADYNDELNAVLLSENIRRSIEFYKSLEETGCN